MDVGAVISKLNKLGERHLFNVNVVIYDDDLAKERSIYSIEYSEDTGIPVIVITMND